MKKFALFFMLFTCTTIIQGSDLPTKEDLLRCFVEIVTNQQAGKIESTNAPYLKQLTVGHVDLPYSTWRLSTNLEYAECFYFRNPNEEKTSIFHNKTQTPYCENNAIIKPADISKIFSTATIDPRLVTIILSIIHCIQGGRIISDPATKRSIEIWNDRGEITKIE